MEFLTKQLKMLGLNTREIRVFTTLSVLGRMKMSKLSLSSKISRTTVDAIVRRLVTQGLISKTRIGGHYEYEVALHDVANRLRTLEHTLNARNGETASPPLERAPEAPAPITHDAQERDMIATVFATHEGERATLLLSTITPSEDRMASFIHLISRAKKSHTKLTLLTTTTVATSLEQYARELLAHSTTYDMQLTFLPPSFSIEDSDVIAFRDIVVILHEKNTRHTSITDVHAVQVMQHLLRIAQGVGWSIDMHTWLRNILDEKRS